MSVGSALRFLGLGPRKPKEHEELAASRPANGEAAREPADQETSMEPGTKAGDSAADTDKEQKPADQAAQDKPADKPADPPKEDAAEASRVKAIVELCALVGSSPAVALGFVNSKASVDDVRAQLAKAKADAVDRNPVDGTVPAAGAAADHGWNAAVDKVNAEAGLKPRS